ncbi:hypothetical protein PAHAL_1G184500 [Panicum hallii]|nr:hypothetical protein PAHAL_1G184500 [Panicum hallii]
MEDNAVATPEDNPILDETRKERTPEPSTDAKISLDIPSSSAIMPLELPSPAFNPEEQDTPSSILFSTDTEEVIGTEEISSEQHQSIPNSVKFKLQGMLQLLEQDLDSLVQDAGPIRSILAEVKDLLTPNLALVLALAAYIKGFEPLILEAKRSIAHHATHQSQKEKDRAHAKEIKQKISDIEPSSAMISVELDRLKIKEAEQLRELQKTQDAIASETSRLERVPILVSQAKDEYSAFTR